MKLPVTILALIVSASAIAAPPLYTLLSRPEKKKEIVPLKCDTVKKRNAMVISALGFYHQAKKSKVIFTDHLAARSLCYLSPSCKSLGMVGTVSGRWAYQHCSASGRSCVTRYFSMSAKGYAHTSRTVVRQLLATLMPLGWKAGVAYPLEGGCTAYSNTSGTVMKK